MSETSIQPYIEPARAIDGWMSDLELYWLAKQAINCQFIAEIGCYKGRSTRVLADHCKGTVYAIDPWKGAYYKDNGEWLMDIGESVFSRFKQNLITKTNVIICRGTLREVINYLPPFDMIFIDGDHRYKQVKDDIELSLTQLKPNGLICGHDYTFSDWPGVKKAVDEIFPHVDCVGSIWFVRGPK